MGGRGFRRCGGGASRSSKPRCEVIITVIIVLRARLLTATASREGQRKRGREEVWKRDEQRKRGREEEG